MITVLERWAARGFRSRAANLIMAASAAMIVLGAPTVVHAQDVAPAPPAGNGVALVNRIQNLEGQMQQMQGQIEMLQHQIQQLQQASKDQYVDLDSRVGKLEHAESKPAAAPAAAATSAPAASAAAAPESGKPAPAKPMTATDKAAADTAYQAAFKALRAGNYVDSAKQFRAFIDKYPDSPLTANAYYWLGGSYYVTQNYKIALAAFQALLQKYPTSPKVPEAQLRVADCEIGLKDYAAARATLAAVIKAHPGTPVAKRAHERALGLPAAGKK